MATLVERSLPEPVAIPETLRARLLVVARAAIAVAARAAGPETLEAVMAPTGDSAAGQLLHAAVFVTLTDHGELRGCMGTLDDGRPVVESVADAAACATRMDPRFPPVSPGELALLDVEVSVLGPRVRLTDPEGFRPGIDGVVVERGGRRGLLLPEVAPMVGFDRETILGICCRKAGLHQREWSDPSANVYAFRTNRFGGPVIAPVEPGPIAGEPESIPEHGQDLVGPIQHRLN
jgi:AmmeMemoRadiSam system protein A